MTRNPGATGTFALLGVVDVLLFSLAGNGGTGSIVFFAGTLASLAASSVERCGG